MDACACWLGDKQQQSCWLGDKLSYFTYIPNKGYKQTGIKFQFQTREINLTKNFAYTILHAGRLSVESGYVCTYLLHRKAVFRNIKQENVKSKEKKKIFFFLY